jgi:hypothetical protein
MYGYSLVQIDHISYAKKDKYDVRGLGHVIAYGIERHDESIGW